MNIFRVLDWGWYIYPRCKADRATPFKGAKAAASNDPKQIREWAAEWRGCGWQADTGKSKIWALDLDRHPGQPDGILGFNNWLAGRSPSDRCRIRTGGGGLALVFRHDGESLAALESLPSVDVLQGNKALTLPGCLHHKPPHRAYEWLKAESPEHAPAWLVDAFLDRTPPPTPYVVHEQPNDRNALRALTRCVQRVFNCGPGERNVCLNKQAYRMGTFAAGGHITEAQVKDELMHVALAVGMTEREARDTIRSGFNGGFRGAK